MIAVLFVVVVVVVVAFMVGHYQKNTNSICKSKKRLVGKTAIITGGTTGIGLGIAIDFAVRGAKVIVACPYPEEGNSAIRIITEKTGSKNVIFKYLDLASLESVRKFAADILKDEERLDILINNAGVGTVGDYQTKDGLNFIMQVNYFGHFLLTLLLLPLLKKTGKPLEPSRIVNTASMLHRIGRINLDHMNSTKYWFQVQIYGNSKLALVLFARELTYRLKGSNVVINNADPGVVGTDIMNSFVDIKGTLKRFLFRNVFKTPWQGAQTAIHVAMDEKAGEVSGSLFKNCKLLNACSAGYSDEMAKILWAESVRLVKMSDSEYNQCFRD